MTTQTFSPGQDQDLAQLEALADYLIASNPDLVRQELAKRLSASDWGRQYFYTADYEPPRPITLLRHQSAILDYALAPEAPFTTIVYSTVKKSGKTTIAGLVGRWAAETWGRFQEIYSVANDFEQAKGRIYSKLVQSIELAPGYNPGKRVLYDPNTGMPLWHVLDRECTHIPTGTKVKAIAGDYKGEAGSNPSLTLWTELWGYTSEASRRLWDELTPVPTRKKSIRMIETYAGYEDESDLLLELYQLGKDESQGGQRIDLPGWGFEDPSPTYVNLEAGLFMYWDSGPVARRMPWQVPGYYAQQAKNLRPNAFNRLHNNYWDSSQSALMPIEWWDSCEVRNLPPLDNRTPAVLGVDASVSNDCTGIVLVTRDPTDSTRLAIRKCRVWKPTPAHPINFSEPETGLEAVIKDWCARYNIVEVAYDAFQLHKLMTDLVIGGVAWCRPFSQGAERSKADKQFHDMIRDRAIVHQDVPDIREHLRNAGAKMSKDEDTKFRIIKKSSKLKIDLAIAACMGCAEALRLNLLEA